jgi:signal transduction histidine kinase
MSDAVRAFSSAGRLALGRMGLLGSRRRSLADQVGARGPRGRLFRKYVLLFIGLVSLVLLVNGALDFWFSYQENKAALIRIQREKAESASRRIEQFVDEIERQIGWTTAAQWAASPLEQRKLDYVRLLRQVPAITELIQIDGTGKEQLKVSRLAMDVIGSETDYSEAPSFTEAQAHRVWFSPVHFRKESEPYITLAMARGGRNDGVIVAEVNLKLIWDVITALKIGKGGYAYVVDRDGRLIAHPDISLVLRNTDLSSLPQVAAARAAVVQQSALPTATIAKSITGKSVLTAHAAIAPLGWLVFVELPLDEALAPVYGSGLRTAVLLALGLGLATLAALFLARHMVVPIRLMQQGAARIGAGELDRRIDIHTGDELEALAGQFNEMAADLQKSYADLEKKVEERTAELGRAVEELRTLREVGQAVSSTLDLRAVLSTILIRSVGLSGADAGAIFRYSRAERVFRLVEAVGWNDALVRRVHGLRIAEAETAMGEVAAHRAPIQLADLAERPSAPLRDASLNAGFRGVLIVPLVGPERVLGMLVLQRRATGEFPPETVQLMQTLASQSVLAIQNARLFREIADKSEQLARASEHKSQFLANMSHELRTPLNAILGYAELLVDGIYGKLPDRPRGVLERIQNSGKHLLALINDVLDLSKIEAGQLTLTLEDYSLPEVVQSVVTVTEPLAAAKGLKFTAALQDDMPMAHGDARRVSQVLLNLVGNAIKFTDQGEIEIHASTTNGQFVLTVRDTGPGIADADQERIFGEFQQIDNSNTRKQGGTGLGLAISKRMVEMQGGTVTVDSVLGQGSTFRVVLPVHVDEVMAAA